MFDEPFAHGRSLVHAVDPRFRLVAAFVCAVCLAVEALAPERIHQCYLPYDAPYAVEKFFRQTRPTLGVIMETEVWPNVMHEASRLGIPMVLADARESEKSRRQAERVIDVMGPAFGRFSAVLAQSDEDRDRLASLGATNITVTGSIKFDIKPDLSQVAAARAWRARLDRPVLLLASTREGEEARFAKALVERPELQALRLAVLHAGRRLAGRLPACAAVAAVGGDGHELVLPLPLGDLVGAYLGQLDAEPAGR